MFISSRKNVEDGKYINMGSGAHFHFGGSSKGFSEKAKKFIPLKGEYNWERFM